MKIHQFPCLEDNFGLLLHDSATGFTAAIDAPEEAAVRKALAETGWTLSDILVTHRHPDHVQGIPALKAAFGCKVTAPAKAAAAVPDADRLVAEGDVVSVGALKAVVWETPGHCSDHVCYHFADSKLIFVADVLFALGCGRVFDDAYDDMWRSLSRIAALPDDTVAYFGHEYTLSNGRFALSVDPDNAALKAQTARYGELRAAGKPTSPTRVGDEKAANPFLRATDPKMAERLGLAGKPAAAVFRDLRERKNRF